MKLKIMDHCLVVTREATDKKYFGVHNGAGEDFNNGEVTLHIERNVFNS